MTQFDEAEFLKGAPERMRKLAARLLAEAEMDPPFSETGVAMQAQAAAQLIMAAYAVEENARVKAEDDACLLAAYNHGRQDQKYADLRALDSKESTHADA